MTRRVACHLLAFLSGLGGDGDDLVNQGWRETERGSGDQEWRTVIHSHGERGLQTCNTLSTYPWDPKVETSI